MKRRIADWIHLVRLALLCAAAALAFLVIRPYLVPEGFGVYGHYRAGAILDSRGHPLKYAGRGDCETCHSEVTDLQKAKASRHAALACETCHGPQAKHVAASDDVRPAKFEVTPLCVRCHEKSAGRPTRVPQVDVADHASGEKCTTCHVPHTPALS